MAFFFQTNINGVILKNILALPSFIVAVNGDFGRDFDKKVLPSTIKSVPYSTTRPSEVMCLCKKNIHIYERKAFQRTGADLPIRQR